MYVVQWLFSPAARRLQEAIGQVKRLENEQRDLLSQEALDHLLAARNHARAVLERRAGKAQLKEEFEALHTAANKWLRPYPSPAVRENVKEFLVAVVTILAFTTFFLQLTKIPTGSMQPSLNGITYENLAAKGESARDWPFVGFFKYWLFGVSHKELIAPFDGNVLKIEPEKALLPFVKRQRVLFGNTNNPAQRAWLSLWFPPDDRWPLAAGISDRLYHKGEHIVDLLSAAGDHLLVDRFTYNFRRPRRGEVIVFKTKGIGGGLPDDVLYIKRLVGLPGEKIQVGDDQHLIINGRRLTAQDRGFERVYTITNPGESRYSGHVNQKVASEKFHLNYPIAPLFPDEQAVYPIPEHRYLVMGDNTLNSLDSRSWGSFPERNIIGRAWCVYWPFTRRFGWGNW